MNKKERHICIDTNENNSIGVSHVQTRLTPTWTGLTKRSHDMWDEYETRFILFILLNKKEKGVHIYAMGEYLNGLVLLGHIAPFIL